MARITKNLPATTSGDHPTIEYSAAIGFDGSRESPTLDIADISVEMTKEEWISYLDWKINRVELNPDSRAEGNRDERLAIAIVLNRADWIQADGCRDIEAACGILRVECRDAVDLIRERRAREQGRFAPVFQKYDVPERHHRAIINGVKVASSYGSTERRKLAGRSPEFRKRQKRERAALEKLAQCLDDKNATEWFRKACADHGLTLKGLRAAVRYLKFWEARAGQGQSKRGQIPQYGRIEVVWFLADHWKS